MFPLTPPSHDPTNQCASHGPTNSMIFYCKLLLPQPDPSIYGRCAFYDTQSTANPCSTSQPSGMRSIPTNNTINPPHAAVGFYPDGWLTSGQSGPHSPNRLGVVVRWNISGPVHYSPEWFFADFAAACYFPRTLLGGGYRSRKSCCPRPVFISLTRVAFGLCVGRGMYVTQEVKQKKPYYQEMNVHFMPSEMNERKLYIITSSTFWCNLTQALAKIKK